MNVVSPNDAATIRRTNGTPNRLGFFLTIWFNELCGRALREVKTAMVVAVNATRGGTLR